MENLELSAYSEVAFFKAAEAVELAALDVDAFEVTDEESFETTDTESFEAVEVGAFEMVEVAVVVWASEEETEKNKRRKTISRKEALKKNVFKGRTDVEYRGWFLDNGFLEKATIS